MWAPQKLGSGPSRVPLSVFSHLREKSGNKSDNETVTQLSLRKLQVRVSSNFVSKIVLLNRLRYDR